MVVTRFPWVVVVVITGLPWVVAGDEGALVVVCNSPASVKLFVVKMGVVPASVVLPAGQPHLYTVKLLHRL